MSDSIKLKVGEWYETAGGYRVKVVADMSLHGVKPLRDGNHCLAITPKGEVISYFPNGSWGLGSYSVRNIVKHLEGCTGWDWVEPKPEVWRDATPEDAIRQPHPRCRVRISSSDNCVVYAYGVLVGYYVSGTGFQWVVDLSGTTADCSLCQVLDEPAVPPSASESEVQ